MPFRNGTGPTGAGAGTGRGMGGCIGTNPTTYSAPLGLGMRRGRGCNRGCGRGYGYRNFTAQPGAQTRRAMLADQKQMLEQQLAAVNKSLESENE